MTDVSRRRLLEHFRPLNDRVYALARELADDAWRLELPRGKRQLRLSLYRSVVGQQLSNAAAKSMWLRVEPLLGQDLDTSRPELLRAAGLSRAKSLCLQGLAGLDLTRLKRMEEEEARRELTSYKGVGPWTADMFLIFALGRPDIFSWQDLILRRTAAAVFGLDEEKDVAELRRRVDDYRPYRSFLALLLWRAADIGRLSRK